MGIKDSKKAPIIGRGRSFSGEDHVEAEKAEELIIDSNKMNKKAIWPYEDGLLV